MKQLRQDPVSRPALLFAAISSIMAVQALADAPRPATEEIVVTASGHAQSTADAPASISVISQEALRKQSYTSIVDAVQDIPGVFVTGGGNMQDISIRGMSDNYTLYMVDGRPLSAGRSVNTNGSDGGKQIGLPPLAMIERVEVIRGPMSSLYGSEAMGGVVNVITRAAPAEWGGSIAGDYTYSMNDISNDEYTTDFYLGGPLSGDDLGLELTGSYQHADESDHQGGDDSASSQAESNTTSLGARLNWQVNDANRVGLVYDWAKMETERNPGKSISDQPDGRGNPAERTEYDYEKETRTVSHLGNYGRLSTNTYLTQDLSEVVQSSDKKEEVVTFNTQATYSADHALYTFGGRYKTEKLVDETNGLLDANVPIATDTVERWIGAVFAEVEWQLHDDVSLTTGLRYDDDELFGGHFSPRAYLNWSASEAVTVKGGISTGYSQPSLAAATPGFGRGTGGPGSPNQTPNGDPISRALIIGNDELDPETSVNYELGAMLEEGDLQASVTAFQTVFKDKIAEDRYCVSDVDRDDWQNYSCEFSGNNYLFLSTRKNIDEAEMRGIELTADYWLSNSVEVGASYTYTDSEQKSGDFKGEPLNRIPKHMANAKIDWYAANGVNAWAKVSHRGETTDYLGRTEMSEGTPGYTLADVGATWRATTNFKLLGGLYNVANKEITNDSYGVVLDGRRLNVGFTYDF